MDNTITIEVEQVEHTITIEAPNETYQLVVEEPKIELIEICLQGPPGPPGDATAEFTYEAGATLSGHRAVITNDSMTVIYADNTILNHRNSYVGITTQAANSGSSIKVRSAGEIMENSWNWIVDEPIYFSTNGILTQTPPLSGKFIKIIAIANSPKSIFLTNREAITIDN